jgi:hypothetical protein
MKIVRLGMTESGILLLTFAHQHGNFPPPVKHQIFHYLLHLTNWLYTTSGYYDKAVTGSKFNFTETAVYTDNFNNLIKHLGLAVNGCNETQFYFHDGFIRSLYESLKDRFLNHYGINNFKLLNDTKTIDRVPFYYEKIKGKKVLVVSSFAELCVQQYTSGNIYNLGIGFPTVKGVVGVTPPYCFLNTGPHKNYFETLSAIYEEIKKADFDVAVLGCGVYGHMLCHLIHTELKKDAVYIGGCVTNIFGILSSREKDVGMGKDVKTNEFWVLTIPDKYKPPNYKDIENGCYW